jgi:hypothetical protein
MTTTPPTQEEVRAYDSRVDTHEHIGQVRGLVLGVAADLTTRAHVHDASKLTEPELSVFNEFTPKLRDSTYGSDEYKRFLDGMGEGLRHHYAANDHHPEHFVAESPDEHDGIAAMSLVQLTEMLCDWIAATRRHADGDIHRSIEQNAERFGYGEEIKRLLHQSVGPLLATEKRSP